jgi:hypothetical protein
MSFSRKDLILLHKYKDENFKKALVEYTVGLVKHEVFRLAMKGETMARVACDWAHTQAELDGLAKEEQQVRELVKEAFKDSVVQVDTTKVSLIFYQFWEIVVTVNWG